MMRNRGPRAHGMTAGAGLLGEGPQAARMMGGVGGGLLGNAPKQQQHHQQHQQQQRALLNAPNLGGRASGRDQMMQGRQGFDRQNYNQGRFMEQQTDQGYYEENTEGYLEEPAYQEDYGYGEQTYEQGGQQQDYYDQQEQDYNYDNVDRGLYDEPKNVQRGLLDDPPVRRGLMNQSRTLFDQPEVRNQPMEQRRLSGRQESGRDMLKKSRFEEQHRVNDRQIGQSGLLRSPREAYMDVDPVIMEQPRRDHVSDRRSLMDLPDPPRPPRGLMQTKKEPPSLLGTPVERQNVRDMGRQQRTQPGMNERGLLDRPREDRAQQERRGLLNNPREPKMRLPQQQQQQRSPQAPRRRSINREMEKQSELMEKADLQMKLLQQQEKIRELEQMEMMKQQAVLMQQQQQHMQQMQQQKQYQQQMEIKKQMFMAQAEQMINRGQQKTGGIPSLLDMSTKQKTTLGKRPNIVARKPDNKRARLGSAGQRDRKPLQLSLQQDKRTRNTRDRFGGRRLDRNRRGKNNTRRQSPNRKKRDRKESGSSNKDNRSDRNKGRVEKEKDDKNVSKPEKKVEPELYDPAQPTDEVVVVNCEISDGKGQAEKMDVQTKEEKGEKDGVIVLDDDNKDEKAKDDKQKVPEISLTVTVNKKGRSVDDGDQKESPKGKQTSTYKCNVCSVNCFNEESFARHMNGKRHSEKMKIIMSTGNQLKSRIKAEEHLRNIEGNRQSQGPTGSAGPKGKALETMCKVCNTKFTGAYRDHKESPDHKALEDKSKAGCKICKVSTFSNYQDYVKHLQSDWHKKKEKQASWPECKLCNQRFKSPRKFVQHCKTDHHIENKKKLPNEEDEDELSDLVTLDTIGYEDDGSADKKSKSGDDDQFLKPSPAKTSTPKASQPLKAETSVKVEEEENVIPETYDATVAVGQTYVVPVSGFFCKLCHKFYNNETAARVSHCQSPAHYEKLKKFLASKKTKAEEIAKKVKETQSDAKNSESSPELVKNEENENQSVKDENNEEAKNQSINEAKTEDGDQSPSESNMEVTTQDEEQVNENDQSHCSQEDGNTTIEVEDGNTTIEIEDVEKPVESVGNDSKATVDNDSEAAVENDSEASVVSQQAETVEIEVTASPVKQQRARRGGGSGRARRGRR